MLPSMLLERSLETLAAFKSFTWFAVFFNPPTDETKYHGITKKRVPAKNERKYQKVPRAYRSLNPAQHRLDVLEQGSQTRGPPDVFVRPATALILLKLLLKLLFFVVSRHF